MSFPVNDPQDQATSGSGQGAPIEAHPGPQVPAQPAPPPAERVQSGADQTVPVNPFAPGYQPPAPGYPASLPAAPRSAVPGGQPYPPPLPPPQLGPPGPGYFGDAPATSPLPATTPPGKRNGATVVLAVLTVLLLLGLAALGAFFVTSKNGTDKKLADQKAQIERLQSDLETKGAELSRTQDDLEEAEQDLDAADKCVDAVRNFFQSRSEFQARKRAEVMLDKC